MPDTLDATAPLLTIPDALASEAAAVLLGGDAGALKTMQEKLAAALTGQGLAGAAAGTVADGWMRDVAAGIGASATPDDAIAQASRIAAGTAARMAEAARETAAMTGEQRIAVALAQGPGTGAASDLSAALFSGVMDPLARPVDSADPIAALSQALTAPPPAAAAPEAAPASPSDKLAAALASGVGVRDAVEALGSGQGGAFAEALEQALSSGADTGSAVVAAQTQSAVSSAQATSIAVEQTDDARILGALASGRTEGAGGALGGGPAFTSVLNDALAQGAQPDAALGASARAQAEMAARQDAAVVVPKPTDALVASLSSGQNVAATLKTFAAGLDGAASGGFGEALGRALSSGQEMSGALGSAQQTVSMVMALSAETAKGVKSDGLIAALASGQNVQQAVQALGGSGAAFSTALGQALADGRAPGQALAAARQSADTVRQNAQSSEVPVSAENKALADLATPAPGGEQSADGGAETAQKAESPDGEPTEQAPDAATAEGNEEGKEESEAEKDGGKEEGAKEDAKGEADGKAAAEASSDGESTGGEASPAPAKPAGTAEPALTAISFDAPGTGKGADADVQSAPPPASPASTAPSAAPAVTKALTSDPFAVAAQTQRQVARAIEKADAVQKADAIQKADSIQPPATPPATPTVVPATPANPPPHHAMAPILSATFDAAAFAKALAIAEGTAAPAGFAVFHLIEAMFQPGEAGSRLVGIAVVANPDSPLGVWQYSVDGGSGWLAVGAVGDGSALLLPGSALLRFLPASGAFGTAPSLGLRAVNDEWTEGFSGAGDRLFTLAAVGGITPLSADVARLSLEVTPVNGAPVATGTQAVLGAVAEDGTDPAGASVASLFGGLFSDPTDAVFGSAGNGFAGVAVVANAATAAQGQWQYWSGSAWTAVGDVAEGAALILATDAKLRFLPATDWNGTTPALSVRLIEDGGAPVVTGGRADLTNGVGGSTVYSAETVALTGTVTPVNDAPQVTAGTAALTTVKGVAVAVTGLSVSDADAGPLPMLVTLTAGHGTLTLANAGWDAVITGNGTDSVTIRATLATINGLVAATNGLLYNASTYTGADSIRIVVDDLGNGGAGGPLTAGATIGVTVAPPNASPVLKDTNLDVTVAAEALAAPKAGTAGIAVSNLVGLNGAGPANVTDADAGAVTGIALTGTNETYGRWWFSTDNGATWSLVGAVNDSDSALLLRAADRLHFQPDAAVPATVNGALTIRAWDQTTGSAGTKVAVTLGAGSAFSSASDTVTLHPGVLIPNGTFDKGLTGWSYTGGATVGTTGDGQEGTLTSAGGRTPTQLEDFLGLAHGSIAAATGTVPSFGHAMKLTSAVTVTKDTTLTFDWSFVFSDPGYHDFAFVSVNGAVTLLAKSASANGTFSVVIPANSTLSLGFGTSDTSDNSVNPVLRIDNVKLTTVASGPMVLDMSGDGVSQPGELQTLAEAGILSIATSALAAQVHSQPLAPSPQADQGRFDFAALLSSGLGLPDNVSVVKNGIDDHFSDWSSIAHSSETHNAANHALPIAHNTENS